VVITTTPPDILAGQPIVAGWAYQMVAQLGFERDSWVVPVDAKCVRPEEDANDVVHKATGGWVREARKKDRRRLLRFLDKHAATMPRTALRYAIEHLGEEQRARYLSMKKAVEADQGGDRS
jgi:DNA alkylation repair enzyme